MYASSKTSEGNHSLKMMYCLLEMRILRYIKIFLFLVPLVVGYQLCGTGGLMFWRFS